jgi:catechol 2,3-dioxygenase-like lactoylglutathione lyase family enzyme
VRATALDHIALWVTQRHADAAMLVRVCGLHEIERTDDFTLLGGDAREGKLTLFDADPPRERGALERVVLRVPDLAGSLARLRALGTACEQTDSGDVRFDTPSGIPVALVEGAGVVDLAGVEIVMADPDAAARRLYQLGFEPGSKGPVSGGRYVVLRHGHAETQQPLLNHLALLVDSAAETQAEARERGLEIEKVVDAANTTAVFVWAPEGLLLEYVEHKPSFSLV